MAALFKKMQHLTPHFASVKFKAARQEIRLNFGTDQLLQFDGEGGRTCPQREKFTLCDYGLDNISFLDVSTSAFPGKSDSQFGHRCEFHCNFPPKAAFSVSTIKTLRLIEPNSLMLQPVSLLQILYDNTHLRNR